MPFEKPTIVLIDMDGTTVRHLNPRLLHLLETLDDIAYRAARFLGRLMRKGNELEKTLLPLSNINIRHKQKSLIVHRAIHKFRRKPVEQIVEPCPGIQDLLDYFKNEGIPMALVSNGLGKGYGHDVLKKFALKDYFEARVFREDIGRSKPHPDPLLRALDVMGAKPSKSDVIWYIGDRRKDVEAALAAAKVLPCKVEPFSYGLQAAIAVLERNVGPDHIIIHYQDFTQRLKKVFG